tara:strand:- start:2731 stop:2913 length:183 start_codon:yes stop_codon:yes gene_type:complete
MILITFENQETLEFDDRFTAEVHVDTYVSSGYPVIKLRCSDASDYTALQNYIDVLNYNIQ